MSSRKNSSRSKGKSDKAKKQHRTLTAKRLIVPTFPNTFGTVALIDSDFYPKLCKELAPYNTIGNQGFFWRVVYDQGTIAQLAGVDTLGAIYFQLSSSPGASDFAAVFDQYRLRAVSVSFDPVITSNMNAASAEVFPRLYTVIDYDDASTPGSRSALQQYDTMITAPPGTGVVRTLIPHLALGAYASGTFSGYANMQEVWLDLSNTNVQHYGVKYGVEQGVAGQTVLQAYSASVTAFWQFRSTR